MTAGSGFSRKWLVCVCAAGVLVAALAVMTNLAPAVPAQRLPDGSSLVLRKLTYGTTHRLALGNSAQRLLGWLLPRPITTQLGIRVLTYTNVAPQLLLWVEHRLASGPQGTGNWYLAPTLSLEDEAGTELECGNPLRSRERTNCVVLGFACDAVPRASRRLTVRLRPWQKKTASSTNEVRLTAANPAFSPEFVSLPMQYPVQTQQAELTFVLKSFARASLPLPFETPRFPPFSRPQPDLLPPAGPGGVAGMEMCFEILEQGHSASNWHVRRVSLGRDSGGSFAPAAGPSVEGAGRNAYRFYGGLGTNMAWTLRFGLECQTPASNELFTVRAVPVPGRGGGRFDPVDTQLQGVTLSIIGFPDANPHRIRAQFSPLREELDLALVRLVDDQGREAKLIRREVPTCYPAGVQFNFGVELPPDAKSCDLTFALRPERVMEVKATPRPDNAVWSYGQRPAETGAR